MLKVPFQAVSFMYHEITDNTRESGFQTSGAELWKHSVNDFKRDMSIILVKKALIKLITEIDIKKNNKYIFLTFDDGGKSAMQAAEFLFAQGVKAHFFISTSFIDEQLFLSKSAIKELHQQGHVIGSHSHTHPSYFPSLNIMQMREEWHRSVSILSDIIENPVITGSIPSGFWCSNTLDSAGQAGIKYLFTSDYRVKPWWHKNILCLGRIGVQRNTSPAKIENYSNFRGIVRARAYIQFKQIVKWLIWPIYKKLRLSNSKV